MVARVRSGDEAAGAAGAVGVEELVAADGLDGVGGGGDEVVDGVGVGLAPQPAGIGAEGGAAGGGVEGDAAGVVVLALAEDEGGEGEKAAGRAVDGDADPERGVVAGGEDADGDGAVGEAIDPAAVGEADLEGRGLGEQAPAVPLARVDEQAQAAGAGDVVGIARGGEEAVEGGVADREQRGEDAVHPGGRAEGGLVEEHALPAAQDGPMAAGEGALLVAEDDVAGVRALGDEEGEQAAAVALLVAALGIEGGGVEGEAGERRRVLEEAPRRGGSCGPGAG